MLKCYLVFLSTGRPDVPYTERIHVLNKLHSVVSYSAVGHFEYNVNEPTIYILKGVFKEKHTLQILYNDQLMKMFGTQASMNLILYSRWEQLFSIHYFSVHNNFVELTIMNNKNQL